MSIVLIILPGPDTGLVTQNTIAQGRRGGVQTALGSISGVIIHTLAAVVGLSAIIVKSAFLFSIFKYVGAFYLIYLGIMSLWAIKKKGIAIADNKNEKKNASLSAFRQGFLTNVLNPKVAVFFLTFLPQFLEPGSNTFLQFLIMGLTYAALTLIWFLMYVYLIHSINVWMKKPSVQRAIQGISGIVLLSFGIKLALERRP
ncbi:LysE family translocator [Aneurinibacillus migulanus]|uniref:LysE family translocator n=1 Tax=Aneurinibacillus migulanus TaxID=47500 RepID=UPI0006A11CE5|nr:LysE family translocator [Aneurinibacillus migulanus]MCP1354686.1 LysE family translocator [Aneurinibacillus migulanus]CEH31284.1 Homoserine/Threonine efflux protein [Aneurinibacillus migulanus]